MPTFEHTVEIEAPIEHVFEFSTTPDNWVAANSSLRDLEIIEETDGGYDMTAVYSMLGMKMDGDMDMRIVEPNEHVVTTFDSSGMTGSLEYHYSEADGITTVVQSADYKFGDSLLERILEPVARRVNERQFRNSLQNMKDLIEADFAEAERDPLAA